MLNLNRNGNLVHDTCLGSDSSKCSSSDISLVAIRDASNYYFRTSDLINNNYQLNDDNYILRVEDSSRINLNSDGSPVDKTCIYENWLYLNTKI